MTISTLSSVCFMKMKSFQAIFYISLVSVYTEAGQVIEVGYEPIPSSYVIESLGSLFMLPQEIPSYGIIVGFTGFFASSAPTYLQIWRPLAQDSFTFQLIYQVSIIPTSAAVESHITWVNFILPDGINCLEVERGDKLAVFIKEIPSSVTYEWSFDGTLLPLAHSFNRESYPSIGENVTFDKLYFPFRFSVEASIDIGTLTTDGHLIPPTCEDTLVLITSTTTHQPMTGIPGLQGPPGPIGPRGYKGENGERGDPGVKGDPGEAGVPGLLGPQGPKGDRGLKGNEGKQGIPGSPGTKGLKGNRGEEGFDGNKGAKGDRGPQGLRGDIGYIGPVGPVGPPGDRGDRGLRGPKGERGAPAPFINPSLLKGQKGERGLVGPPGPPAEINVQNLTGLLNSPDLGASQEEVGGGMTIGKGTLVFLILWLVIITIAFIAVCICYGIRRYKKRKKCNVGPQLQFHDLAKTNVDGNGTVVETQTGQLETRISWVTSNTRSSPTNESDRPSTSTNNRKYSALLPPRPNSSKGPDLSRSNQPSIYSLVLESLET